MREQKAERLLYLMTQLPDDLLEETVSYQKSPVRSVVWNKGAMVAACLCVCLIGGLAWGNALRNSTGETGAAGTGVAAGGTLAVQGDKPTLAPSTDHTGARPVDSTDELLSESTTSSQENTTSDVGMMVSEIWYKGQLYVDTGILLERLTEDWVLQGVVSTSKLEVETAWTTKDPGLVGAKVYHMTGDDTGFYVETAGGYRYYGKGSTAE